MCVFVRPNASCFILMSMTELKVQLIGLLNDKNLQLQDYLIFKLLTIPFCYDWLL